MLSLLVDGQKLSVLTGHSINGVTRLLSHQASRADSARDFQLMVLRASPFVNGLFLGGVGRVVARFVRGLFSTAAYLGVKLYGLVCSKLARCID